jgi:nucleotide-binding universal stress UspA family protein
MGPMSIKRIVVGTDFSAGADVALDHAISLAGAFKATLDLVHVVEPGILFAPTSLGSMALANGAELFEEIDRALTSRAQRVTAAGLVCQTESLHGHAPRALVAHAQKTGAELIVVGTHGGTGIEHAILGSVAERVVHHATCPVLVIPLPRERAN